MEQQILLSELAADTLQGLSANPKFLLSKYFYDDIGSSIFQDIMHMPEYYLTDCEMEIFSTHKSAILDAFEMGNKQLEIIELGAGDGLKTKILLSHFLENDIDFRYIPIDISEKAVINLVRDIKNQIPGLTVEGLIGDYFELIEKLNGKKRKIILFLGSNLGNYNYDESLQFLKHLRAVMHNGDMILIGLDLKKDPELILRAYNDPHGHTSAFNLNLLQRINNELDADFNLADFSHEEVYHKQSGKAESYLVSQAEQIVNIKTLDRNFEFKAGERIFMEMSQKYDSTMIEELADNSGFEIVMNFNDHRHFFVNSLWRLKQ